MQTIYCWIATVDWLVAIAVFRTGHRSSGRWSVRHKWLSLAAGLLGRGARVVVFHGHLSKSTELEPYDDTECLRFCMSCFKGEFEEFAASVGWATSWYDRQMKSCKYILASTKQLLISSQKKKKQSELLLSILRVTCQITAEVECGKGKWKENLQP